MKFHVLVPLLLPLLLAGCAAPDAGGRASPVKTADQILPDARPHGRIAAVNHQGQFVVVDFNVGGMPPLQSPMNVYRKNKIVATINLSGPVSDNLVAADIVSGEPEVGDEAIWDREKSTNVPTQKP